MYSAILSGVYIPASDMHSVVIPTRPNNPGPRLVDDDNSGTLVNSSA